MKPEMDQLVVGAQGSRYLIRRVITPVPVCLSLSHLPLLLSDWCLSLFVRSETPTVYLAYCWPRVKKKRCQNEESN